MEQANSRVYTDDTVSTAILDLIRRAQENVILVSPYNKFWNHLQDEIRLAVKRGVRITAIYRAGEDKNDIDWLGKEGAAVYAVEKLHAKIYLNESTMIVTSMNLLDSSSKNSKELAVRINDQRDQEEIRSYVLRLKDLGRQEYPKASVSQQLGRVHKTDSSQPGASFRRRPDPDLLTASVSKVWNTLKVAVTGGTCIRCRQQVPYDPEKPLCNSCYKEWNRYKNFDYAEKYCHRCSQESDTTQARPLCKSCYRTVK